MVKLGVTFTRDRTPVKNLRFVRLCALHSSSLPGGHRALSVFCAPPTMLPLTRLLRAVRPTQGKSFECRLLAPFHLLRSPRFSRTYATEHESRNDLRPDTPLINPIEHSKGGRCLSTIASSCSVATDHHSSKLHGLHDATTNLEPKLTTVANDDANTLCLNMSLIEDKIEYTYLFSYENHLEQLRTLLQSLDKRAPILKITGDDIHMPDEDQWNIITSYFTNVTELTIEMSQDSDTRAIWDHHLPKSWPLEGLTVASPMCPKVLTRAAFEGHLKHLHISRTADIAFEGPHWTDVIALARQELLKQKTDRNYLLDANKALSDAVKQPFRPGHHQTAPEIRQSLTLRSLTVTEGAAFDTLIRLAWAQPYLLTNLESLYIKSVQDRDLAEPESSLDLLLCLFENMPKLKRLGLHISDALEEAPVLGLMPDKWMKDFDDEYSNWSQTLRREHRLPPGGPVETIFSRLPPSLELFHFRSWDVLASYTTLNNLVDRVKHRSFLPHLRDFSFALDDTGKIVYSDDWHGSEIDFGPDIEWNMNRLRERGYARGFRVEAEPRCVTWTCFSHMSTA